MPVSTTVEVNDKALLQKLRDLQAVGGGRGSGPKPKSSTGGPSPGEQLVMAFANLYLSYTARRMNTMGKGGGSGDWKKLSPISAMVSQPGRFKKTRISSDPRDPFKTDDAEAALGRGTALHDTGALKRSIGIKGRGAQPQGIKTDSNGIWLPEGLTVTLGTKRKGADLHQKGGTSTFRFGPREQRNYERNVVRGRKGNWNAAYFVWWNILKKKDGQTVEIPRRAFLVLPDERTKKNMVRIFKSWFKRFVEGEG